MLVLISDLHLTDGTCGNSISPAAMELFAQRLNDMAVQASWRNDGTYRPIDRIDLVLLGDILDPIQSTKWRQTKVRPWDNALTSGAIEVVTGVIDDVLKHNSQSIRTLRQLASDGAIRVPAGTEAGHPDYKTKAIPVAVRTHYMVGNHDWPLHLRGAGYDLVRQKVAHHLGLANSHTSPFPHDPTECEELIDTMRRHRVIARHGDIFDPLSFAGDRDTSSLGDVLAIELVGRFISEVRRELSDDLPESTIHAIPEVNNIRPVLFVPVWLEGVLERTCASTSVRKNVKQIWDRIVDEFLQLPIARGHDANSPVDLIDGLASNLKFSKRPATGWTGTISNWLHNLRGASSDSYYQHALAEPDFRNRRARHIVYGHTHQAESVPLDASYADAFVLNQMYFNAGTWRPVYRPTILAPTQHEFIPNESLSFLSFFQGDERGGRPFETWSGTLGMSPVEISQSRNETTVSIHAAEQQTPTSRVPFGAPHFRTAFASRSAAATD